jgi:5-methylcytosine-specific restriction enzyme subunit McrC
VARTIYPCEEFVPIEVPLDSLMEGGQLRIYPEAEKYFDLDWRAGRLVVAPKSFVGFIPINDHVAIHVRPRFPIANLFYLLQRSSASLQFIQGHVRTYEVPPSANDSDPVSLLALQLTTACVEGLRSGLLRRYVTRDSTSLGGSLDFSRSVSEFLSRGVRHKLAWTQTELTSRLRENQLVKGALTRIVRHYRSAGDKESLKFAAKVRQVLFMFDEIELPSDGAHFDERDLAAMVKRLPRDHRDYASILWISFLIYSRRGIALEAVGKAQFETFVVNLAVIFEDYVRVLVTKSAEAIVPGGKAYDGNVTQVRLFVSGDTNQVKPDIYIKVGKNAVLILDAKYKPKVSAADRYEVLAFCEALKVKTAILLSPSSEYVAPRLLGLTAGGVALHLCKINLSASDMNEAESKFLADLQSIVAEAH